MGNPPRFAGLTVLVIDDHEDTRDAMRQLIESLGCHVLLARNGREALGRIVPAPPDVIFCDLRMDGMDGFAFMGELRKTPGAARARVIAVSGLAGEADLGRMEAAGFDGHLVKPVDYDLIVSQLERALQGRSPR